MLTVGAFLVVLVCGWSGYGLPDDDLSGTGLAAAGLIGAQGLALLAGGLVAQRWSSAAGVAAVGIAAVLLLLGLLTTAPARELGRST